MAITRQSIWKAALLFGASISLSGCVYDIGLGFASDGNYDDAYGCDPYAGYDAYYNCDYGQAFIDIGFGGGWYDNYYYPGHGIFLFDTFGRRHPMREQYRRYWSERRHNWYREHRGRDVGRNRDEGREHDYRDNARSERSTSPDRQGGRMRDRDDDRRDGRRDGRRRGPIQDVREGSDHTQSRPTFSRKKSIEPALSRPRAVLVSPSVRDVSEHVRDH